MYYQNRQLDSSLRTQHKIQLSREYIWHLCRSKQYSWLKKIHTTVFHLQSEWSEIELSSHYLCISIITWSSLCNRVRKLLWWREKKKNSFILISLTSIWHWVLTCLSWDSSNQVCLYIQVSQASLDRHLNLMQTELSFTHDARDIAWLCHHEHSHKENTSLV